MPSTFWILGLTLWAVGVQATPPARTVDLGAPGALDAIEKANPEHYRKIVSILDVSRGASCETLPQVLKAKFGAEATSCHPYQVLTSYPARRHLAFRLGDTAYVATVPLTGTSRALPAR